MPAQDRTPSSSSRSEQLLRRAQEQMLAKQTEASSRHDRFMMGARADRRSRAVRAAQLVGVVVLAVLAGSGRPRGGGPGPRPFRPRKSGPRPGGHPLPQPVRPDRPNGLSGGAAAELTFDD